MPKRNPQRVNLFYLSPNPYGGWVTYTVHLIHALESQHKDVRLYKLRPRTEGNTRPFGSGMQYTNISMDDALKLPGTNILTAVAKNFAACAVTLAERGAWIVCHDPTEFKNLPDNMKRMFVIRPIALEWFPHAHYIPHPYKRHGGATGRATLITKARSKNAVSVSRIDFDKHTEILLDANRILPANKRIHIYGFENRLYTKFKIMPKYPEWEQSKVAFPREEGAAFELLRNAKYMCDMSIIKGDGGGSQYTFLEAMDAGCVPVLHWGWFVNKGEMKPGKNCLAVSGGEELAALLRKPPPKMSTTLRSHNHKTIGARYVDIIDAARGPR